MTASRCPTATATNGWSAGGPAVSAAGAARHARAEWSRGHGPLRASDALYGPITSEWQAHLHEALPELAVHDYAAALAQLSDDLAAAVRASRVRGLSWDRIGRAAGISRQAAGERWGP